MHFQMSAFVFPRLVRRRQEMCTESSCISNSDTHNPVAQEPEALPWNGARLGERAESYKFDK